MRKVIPSLVAVGLAAGMLGCHSGSTSGSSNGSTGTVAFGVVDGPFPASCFSEASVVIDRIELIRAGTTGIATAPGTTASGNGAGTTGTGTGAGAGTGTGTTGTGSNPSGNGGSFPGNTSGGNGGTFGGNTAGGNGGTFGSGAGSGSATGNGGSFGGTGTSGTGTTAGGNGGTFGGTGTGMGTGTTTSGTGATTGTGANATGTGVAFNNGTAVNQGPVVVTAGAQTYNLLDLVGGVSETAAVAEVPAGTYDRVRVVVSRGVLTWSDGFSQSFTAATTTAFEITPTAAIVVAPHAVTNLLLDFDLGSTFARPGAVTETCDQLKTPGAVRFTPVVRVVDLDTTGRIAGNVVDARSGQPFPGVAITAVPTQAGSGTGAGGTTGTTPTGTGTTGTTVTGTSTSGTGTGTTAGSGTGTGTGTTAGTGATGAGEPFTTISSPGLSSTTTGSHAPAGAFALYVPPGTYLVTFEAPGRAPQTQTVTVGTVAESAQQPPLNVPIE